MVLRERRHAIRKVADIPEQPAAHGSRRTDGQVREGAVERTEPQPRLGRELQGTDSRKLDSKYRKMRDQLPGLWLGARYQDGQIQ
jgi:hypothetical protein